MPASEAYYNRDNPPPWWLINLGPIIAITIVVIIVSMCVYRAHSLRCGRLAMHVRGALCLLLCLCCELTQATTLATTVSP